MPVMNKWSKVKNYLLSLDYILIIAILALIAINILVQFSANNQNTSRIYNDVVYLVISLVVMFIVAGFNYKNLQNIAVPLYVLSIILLVAVFFLGIKVNGAQRWLNVGIRIQPSELCKIAVPLMVAYYLAKQDEVLGYRHYFIAALIVLLPFLLIAKQPDLGTAILVLLSGFFVLFFANLPWKTIILGGLATIMALPLFWLLLKDYQKYRVLTLIDPQSDPLGKGYHIIQSIIAIGSGGVYGKGYLQGSQIHLDFIPEKSTDFIITVLAEEWGYLGVCLLLFVYLIVALRGLRIMRYAPDLFSTTLAGSITLLFVVHILVNVGMVGGIFPVVGAPLPLISYGGTATVILMFGLGVLLSIGRQRRGS